MVDRLQEFLKAKWNQLRAFDYTNLSFLYIACLVTIALVYSVFRASQYYLNQQELRALDAIQQIGGQRELVSELERLIAFAQNRTSPEYDVTIRRLVETYSSLSGNHKKISIALDPLRRHCNRRQCGALFDRNFFILSPEGVKARLSSDRVSSPAHNHLLQQLFRMATNYQASLRDTLSLSFDVIHAKNKTTMTFDFIAYFSLIVLLLIQAVYVFRPAIRRLNASLSTRSDFLSRISHEIRNPMNSIIGMADILKSTRLNSEQQQYVDNLVRSGHALLDMLNNLIDSAAIERGKLSLKVTPFNLFTTVNRSLNLVAVQAHHKNISLYLNIDPSIHPSVIGDSVRLEQVLINLLNNAVKFTEKGSVSLNISLISDSPNDTTIRFTVEDTGIGIQRQQIGEIFESFVQADSYIKRKYGGSGLGLSIASELVRMMGGELRASSEIGQGSSFHFTLVMPRQSSAADQPSLLGLSSRKFIFLSSLGETEAYRRFFRILGAKHALLHSSHELRAYLSPGSADDTSQLLIDDSLGIISMITCRNIAQEHGLGGRSVALMRTNFTRENMDLLKRNGFTRFLFKPLQPWELLTLPLEVRDDLHEIKDPTHPLVPTLKAKNLKILVVDDSNDNLFLLKELVTPFAQQVHFAENGLEALEKFKAGSYDAIFMDIQMPVMDGYTAIKLMRDYERQQQNAAGIPIFAVTAHAGLVDAQRCRDSGFTDRIVKPVVRNDIYRGLAKAFGLEGQDAGVNASEPLPEKYLTKLMPTFLRTRKVDLENLNLALGKLDFESIQRIGHKMKGSSASYGFKEASALSQELELAAKAGDVEMCTMLVGKMEHIFKPENSVDSL